MPEFDSRFKVTHTATATFATATDCAATPKETDVLGFRQAPTPLIPSS